MFQRDFHLLPQVCLRSNLPELMNNQSQAIIYPFYIVIMTLALKWTISDLFLFYCTVGFSFFFTVFPFCALGSVLRTPELLICRYRELHKRFYSIFHFCVQFSSSQCVLEPSDPFFVHCQCFYPFLHSFQFTCFPGLTKVYIYVPHQSKYELDTSHMRSVCTVKINKCCKSDGLE